MTLRVVAILLNISLFSWLPGQPVPFPSDVIWSGKGHFPLGKAVPGVVEVRGEAGFPVLKDGNSRVFAAAGPAGKGRVLAFAHGFFLENGENLASESAFDLLGNGLKWAGQSDQPRVGLHPSAKTIERMLQENGFAPQILNPDQLAAAPPQVYCLLSHSKELEPPDIDQVIAYLESGGGVVVATTPWAFAKHYPDFSQSPGNRLISRAGLAFLPDSYCSNKEDIHVVRPMEFVPAAQRRWWETGSVPASSHPSVLAVKVLTENKFTSETEDRARLIEEMKKGKNLGTEDIVAFLHALRLLNGSMGGITPTRGEPVKPGKFPLVDAVIEMETYFNLSLPAGMMYPIPAADDFPGKVPDFSPRVSLERELDCHFKGWAPLRNAGGWNAREILPTGIYAPAGEVIRVEVSPELTAKGYEVVIGSYGGGLDNRDFWHRYPRMQRSEPIRSAVTEVSSGFGGLVGLRIPHGVAAGKQKIKISGGVEAPFFQLGKTDLTEWRASIRHRLAPMAELTSDKMILTVPSEDIREVENPDAVMSLWNRIMDQAAVLAALDRNQYRAERLVFDRQPAAGLLHSGYPMCGHIGEHSLFAVDAERLKSQGFWGFFHEIGHNHQHALWALPGTVETTCNLWSVYLFEKLIGKRGGETHPSMDPLVRLQNRRRYFANGANFEQDWNVWTALDTYLLVQETFGWEPFEKTFAQYNALPREQWPQNQQEINDQWVLLLSRNCGMNLAPYWKTWNLPLSPSVNETLACLPPWECQEVIRWKKIE